MERKEFTLHVATKNVLTDAECLNVMMHWDLTPKERYKILILIIRVSPAKVEFLPQLKGVHSSSHVH